MQLFLSKGALLYQKAMTGHQKQRIMEKCNGCSHVSHEAWIFCSNQHTTNKVGVVCHVSSEFLMHCMILIHLWRVKTPRHFMKSMQIWERLALKDRNFTDLIGNSFLTLCLDPRPGRERLEETFTAHWPSWFIQGLIQTISFNGLWISWSVYRMRELS